MGRHPRQAALLAASAAVALTLGVASCSSPPALAGTWTAVQGGDLILTAVFRDGTATIGGVAFAIVPNVSPSPHVELVRLTDGHRLVGGPVSADRVGATPATLLRSVAGNDGCNAPGLELSLWRSREAALAAVREHQERMRIFVTRVRP